MLLDPQRFSTWVVLNEQHWLLNCHYEIILVDDITVGRDDGAEGLLYDVRPK